MKMIATLILAAAFTGVAAADDQKVNVSAMTCNQFVQTDPTKMNLIISWFVGFYSDPEDPQVIDLAKIDTVRANFIAFCKQQPGFRIDAAADGILGK
jgi:acid stress chaperone HdeB